MSFEGISFEDYRGYGHFGFTAFMLASKGWARTVRRFVYAALIVVSAVVGYFGR